MFKKTNFILCFDNPLREINNEFNKMIHHVDHEFPYFFNKEKFTSRDLKSAILLCITD